MTTEPGMRTSSLSMSVIVHVLVLAAGLVTIPWMKKDFPIPDPVSIELVDIAEIAQTTRVAPEPIKEDKKPDKAKPPENKPPPAPKNTAEKPQEVVKDKPLDKPEDVKKDEVLVDENAPPQKKLDKKDDKKKKVTKAEPKKDFSSVLKNLDVDKVKPITPVKSPDMKADEKPPEAAQNLPVGMKMTMTEKDALRQQLQGCWNFPFGAKDAENLVVEIYMVVNQDRTLQTARIVDMNRYNNDTFFRAAADSAMRAVSSPNCSPFELPPDKYDTWKTITVTFNPKDIF